MVTESPRICSIKNTPPHRPGRENARGPSRAGGRASKKEQNKKTRISPKTGKKSALGRKLPQSWCFLVFLIPEKTGGAYANIFSPRIIMWAYYSAKGEGCQEDFRKGKRSKGFKVKFKKCLLKGREASLI
jgi:hypothetical protein